MEIEFDYRLFNPLYWHIEEAFKNPDIRNILIYGGSSASKTYSISQNLIYNSLVEDNSTIIFRKESTTIDESVYADFKVLASSINEYGDYFIIQDRKIKTDRSRFIFSGMDDPEKIKGVSQFKRTYLNELSKFDHDDWKEVQRRMRGRPNLQIVADWNPISEQHWIKTEIIDKDKWFDLAKEINGNPLTRLSENSYKKINKDGDTILIKVTYMDNYWVVGSPCGTYGFYDKHTINNFEKSRLTDYEDYRVYALGEWGVIRTGGEFFHAFDGSKCVKKIVFSPKNAIHVSVDNNVLPYITVTLHQFDEESKKLTQIHEICAEDPFNTVSKSGEMTRLWLEGIGYEEKLFLYGDASTKSGNTIDDEKRSFLDKFIEQLEKSYIVEDRVPKSNPSVALSGEFINAVWSGELPYSILINETCEKSINDYRCVKKDVNGGILKTRIKNKVTGQSYEEFGHCSDTLRYITVKVFEKEYIKFSNRRKRNTYKNEDMNYFDATKDIAYNNRIIFVIPDCCGMFMMIMVGLVKDFADVIDVVFSDTFDEDIIYKSLKQKPDLYVFECNFSFAHVVRHLRECGVDVIGRKEVPNIHKRINACQPSIKEKFRFRSDYDMNSGYIEFIENMMDYNGKDHFEALNILSFASSYLSRIYFN